MLKGDQVGKLEELRARRSGEISTEGIDALLNSWNNTSKSLTTFTDFYPMRAVTLLEVFTRNWLGKLVDHGAPFLERAAKLMEKSSPKLDFPIALALQGKRFSLGDLVAHSVPLNQFEQHNFSFSVLLGEDLLHLVKGTSDRLRVELKGEAPTPIIADPKKLRSALVRLFQVRHIVTHEAPARPVYSLDDVESFLTAASQFARAVQQFLMTLVYGKYPITPQDMAVAAMAAKDAADAELAQLIGALQQTVDSTALSSSQAAWEKHREEQARLRSHHLLGGSMWPVIYIQELTRLTTARIAELRWWLDREEGEL